MAPKGCRDVQGGRFTVGDQLDDLLTCGHVRGAQEPLRCSAVIPGVDDELTVPADLPPGEAVSGRSHIVLGVGTDPHGEALHELPGEVLVGVGSLVRAGVQPDEHRRAGGDCLSQDGEISRPERAEQLVLPVHVKGEADLGYGGREMPVQQERQLLLEWAGGDDHPSQPP